MRHYSIFVSNHPEAGKSGPATEAASKSWENAYDGPIATPAEAYEAADKLANFYRNVRVFKGREVGKAWYAILRAPF